jgi:predicted RNA polymerase sigma factor
MADGGLAGLAVLAPVVAAGTLDQYGPLHAAHGFLLEKRVMRDERGLPGPAPPSPPGTRR